ncbi:P-loop containing nucleoside triphosphate hydrolase protein [Pelagophyceae sp. CCMP2097]|nr:P-loop containing nucleoside triphosphate hydrolase protein [Pelagophyceae sp. CCMP2097]
MISETPSKLKRVPRGARPTVAIIGRPNVGKSMLVNRMCDAGNKNGAIVFDEPGVTRDRVYQRAEWGGREFDVIDTGGLLFEDDEESLFISEIREQATIALREACVAIVVVDGREGLLRIDEEIAAYLRATWKGGSKNRKVVLAVNKCESADKEAELVAEFWTLGLGEPFACSAIHGNGVAEVLDAILDPIDEDWKLRKDYKPDTKPYIDVALLGRPNVGKSSLLNRLLGDGGQRSIVSDIAGTTRDAVDASLEVDGKVLRFIDTAGVRRKSKVQDGTEPFMVERSLRAVRRCDVVLLVVDTSAPLTDQDSALARRVSEDGRACVIIANKWDIVDDKDSTSTNRAALEIRDSLPEIASWAEIVFVSALTGQRCLKIYSAIERAANNHRRRINTATLNDVVRDAMVWQPPPANKIGKGSAKVYYVAQTSSRPPTIVCMCNDPKLFTDNYKRYLERKLRENLGFDGTPVRIVFRGKRLREEQQDAKKRTALAPDVKRRKNQAMNKKSETYKDVGAPAKQRRED